MSGHSKWSKIKRQKGVTDAKRSQLFTKLAREIIVAARQGGSDSEGNFQLRLAVQRAKDNNMPLDNIERAIKRASGGDEASNLIEMTMEGYGPNKVAILVQALTNNRNRTVQEIRSSFMRYGGNLGEGGSVAWMFERMGVLVVEEDTDPDDTALLAIDAGAEDVRTEGGSTEIYMQPTELEAVRKALEDKVKISSADLAFVPKNLVELDEAKAVQTMNFIDRLEELEDVQHVFSNMDFSETMLEKLRGQSK